MGDSGVFMVKLAERAEIAANTMAYRFEKPANWNFKAGQFIDLTLIQPPETDTEGNTRTFSLASAPSEPTILVVTRSRDSAFKRVLSGLPIGTSVQIEGPFGDLTLHNNVSRPAVFLTGGIGITPVRSILLRATRERLAHRIYLFYANRRPEDAPFLDEMRTLERENPNLTFVPTMTQPAGSRIRWDGETGHISYEMILRHMNDSEQAIYYITGPAGMVSGLHKMLNDAKIDDDDIRLEEFSGY